MANYRGIVRHVRYWRGQIHRWSTAYEFSGTLSGSLVTADAQLLLQKDDAMCYGAVAADGGTYAAYLYSSASGGVPVASYVAFDWTNPGVWIKHSSAAYTRTSITFLPVAETALVVTWPAGISSTGKPVKMRKWFHAVPVSSATTGATGDVNAADLASLTAGATALAGALAGKGLSMAPKKTGIPAGTPTVSTFYGNHQMPRGRRRRALVSASGNYQGPTVRVPQIVEAN